MRDFLAAMFLCSASMLAQGIIDAARLPRGFSYDAGAGEPKFHCEITPMRPRIDFGFRFRSSYFVGVPLSAFEGKGHGWAILTRVTPDIGGKPVHLISAFRLPAVPKTRTVSRMAQGFLLGEGAYAVDVALVDDRGRYCRGKFKVDAHRHRGELEMPLRIEPNVIQPMASRHAPTEVPPGERPLRISVMVNVAPMFQRSLRLRPWDTEILLGTLGPLLELLPAQSVRLVMFSLDQQKTLLTRDGFRLEDIDDVTRTLNALELGTVPVSVLNNKRGHIDLLAGLIRAEMKADDPPDQIVFLGPVSRHIERFPPALTGQRGGGDDPKFYFVQYRPPIERGAFTDIVESAVKTMKGKTFHVHSPVEFATAIRQMATSAGRN